MIDKVKSHLSSHRGTRIDVIVRESDLDSLLFFKDQDFVAQSLLKDYFDDTKGTEVDIHIIESFKDLKNLGRFLGVAPIHLQLWEKSLERQFGTQA